MEGYQVIHEKSPAFYDKYERKGELQQQTHYCPGCGHGIVHKLIAESLTELGVQDLVGPPRQPLRGLTRCVAPDADEEQSGERVPAEQRLAEH